MKTAGKRINPDFATAQPLPAWPVTLLAQTTVSRGVEEKDSARATSAMIGTLRVDWPLHSANAKISPLAATP